MVWSTPVPGGVTEMQRHSVAKQHSNNAWSPHSDSPHSPFSKELPSAAHQFSLWHDLEEKDGDGGGREVKGSALLCPRMREAPANLPSSFAAHPVTYRKKMSQWRDHRNHSEDWENAEMVNLSYQDLGDGYQTKNLQRCLKRLVACKHLQLMHNSLSELHKITLQSCVSLNLSHNSFSSFKKLPKAPALVELNLAGNAIASLSGLSSLTTQYCKLRSLTLTGNPVEFTSNYRNKVFKALPCLEELDGCPRLPSDHGSSASSDAASIASGSSASSSSTQPRNCRTKLSAACSLC